MTCPTLSVLLPFRNAAATLGDALDSTLRDLPKDSEIICVNDGSSDDSLAVVRARADPRVRVLQTPGLGIAGALELARAASSAPLLGRMDADDISLPGRFSRQLHRMRAPEAPAICATEIRLIGEGISEGMRRYVRWQNSLRDAEDHARELFIETPLCHPSVVFSARAIEEIGGYQDGPFWEDYELWLRADHHGRKLEKLPFVGLEWRYSSQQTTFQDARKSESSVRALKARYLAPKIIDDGRALVVWGAGVGGKRMARALEAHGIYAAAFVDIDPKKIGGQRRGVPIIAPSELAIGEVLTLVAVGSWGARDEIRAFLHARGANANDFILCA